MSTKQSQDKTSAAPKAPKAAVKPAAPEHPRFISTTGKPVLLSLLSGHTESVSHEEPGTPLHPRFHRIAMLKGVVPLAMKDSYLATLGEEATQRRELSRSELIVRGVGALVQRATDDQSLMPTLFTNDGRPEVEALATQVGFPVTPSERDAAWETYSDDGDSDSSDPD